MQAINRPQTGLDLDKVNALVSKHALESFADP